jgi:hypothetical protein
VLAKDQIKAGQERSVAIEVELPESVQWYAGMNEIPTKRA